MNIKKILAAIILLSSSFLFPSEMPDFNTEGISYGGMVSKVKIRVTLPNDVELLALVDEHGVLEVLIEDAHFIFKPKVLDVSKKEVLFENIYSNSTESKINAFQFEVLDILSFQGNELAPTAACESGTCCITCGTVTACACGVTMSCDSCCCRGCCFPY